MIDIHLLAQSLLYFVTCITGLVVSITVGVNRVWKLPQQWVDPESNFQGMCILYGDIDWTDAKHFILHSSSASNCNFPIYFSVFGLIIYCLMMGIYYLYALCRSKNDPSIGTQMWVMPFLLTNVVLSFVSLIVACMISVGYKQFCDAYINDRDNVKCSQGEKATWKNLQTDKMFESGPYSVFMSVAQSAAWLALLFLLMQVGLGILRFVRNRRLRGAASQDKSTSDKKKFGNVEPTA